MNDPYDGADYGWADVDYVEDLNEGYPCDDYDPWCWGCGAIYIDECDCEWEVFK